MTEASSPASFRVTLENFPIAIPGGFMTASGGNRSSDPRRFRDGNGVEQVSGQPPTRDDMTIAREWLRDRDAAIYKYLDHRCGKARGHAVIQQLDDDENAFGDPFTYNVLVTAVSKPDTNTEGGGEVAQLSITLAVKGEVA